MFWENKLSRYILASGILHIIIAAVMAGIYAEQPQRYRPLEIKSAVRVQYREPEPPPKPKVVTKVQPKKVAPKKETPKPKEEPKITPQKVEPPKVTRRRRRMSTTTPGFGTGTAPRQRKSAPGVSSIKGARGSTNELPAVHSPGGVEHPDLVTKTAGTGLTPGLTHGSMKTPEGASSFPGAGGKEVAGFRTGTPNAESGVGKLDISGSSGRSGKADKGPGAGVSTFTSRVNVGDGLGTTGLDAGKSDGMDEVDTEPAGGQPGKGKGDPGLGGYQVGSSRIAPDLTTGAAPKDKKTKELPGTKSIPEEKRDGATGKEKFKADAKTNMTSTDRPIDKPEERVFEDALQGEIIRNLNGLRKMHEDWQNLSIPDIPKALQITIELGLEKGKLKLLKLDLHKTGISPKIKDDLTKKIKTSKFKSLFDGKDDPKKWPIKLTGKISWQ